MSYKLGSFNLCKLNYMSKGEAKKNFDSIAHILRDFDIIAIQEIMSIDAFNHLLDKMGRTYWDGICAFSSSSPYFKHGNEYYGFIWKKSRFSLIGYPQIYRWYRTKGTLCLGGLLRPPYVARFTSRDKWGGGFFEFRIINTHIMYGKPKAAIDDMSSENLRREELNILSKQIYKSVADKRYGDNMPAYTFLMGDYNLCLYGEGPKIEYECEIGRNRVIVHEQTDKTSLKRPQSIEPTDADQEEREVVDEDNFGGYYSRNYDHVSFEKDTKEKLSISASRVGVLEDYYGNDLERYWNEVSDHVPIQVDIKLRSHSINYVERGEV